MQTFVKTIARKGGNTRKNRSSRWSDMMSVFYEKAKLEKPESTPLETMFNIVWLEKKHPGITSIQRSIDGAIVID